MRRFDRIRRAWPWLVVLALGTIGARCTPPLQHRTLLVYGDSLSSRGYGWPRAITDPNVDTVNLAVPGETSGEGTLKVIATLETLTGPAVHPDLVFLMWGTNDAILDLPFDDGFMIAPLSARPRVVLGVPPPIFLPGAEAWNTRIEATRTPVLDLADSLDLPVVDFYALFAGRADLFPDGVHPGPEAQRAMWDEIQRAATPGDP